MIKIKNHHILHIEATFQFNENSVKSYNEETIGVQYREKFHELQTELPFLSERIKVEKVEKLATNLHGKIEYVIHIRN